jgi:hypothetical protein
LRPRATTFILVALVALGLCVAECDFLSAELGRRLEPVRCRLAPALGGLCYAASRGLAREGNGHVPGGVFAVVPSGPGAIGLDRDGYVASLDSLENLEDVPLLTGFTLGSREPGAFASSPEAFLGITVIKAFGTTPGLTGMLESVDLKDLENPEVILKGGTVVRLGAGRYALKLERLREVLAQTAYIGMKPELIDLRFRDQAVVRPGTIERANDREV